MTGWVDGHELAPKPAIHHVKKVWYFELHSLPLNLSDLECEIPYQNAERELKQLDIMRRSNLHQSHI